MEDLVKIGEIPYGSMVMFIQREGLYWRVGYGELFGLVRRKLTSLEEIGDADEPEEANET